ncbi:hypothetical protein DFH06DRAFT_641775 [Mycena polygramma]|nr:hypothetical protein DFH06DRAFT_641775 [Mycena polygramma]
MPGHLISRCLLILCVLLFVESNQLGLTHSQLAPRPNKMRRSAPRKAATAPHAARQDKAKSAKIRAAKEDAALPAASGPGALAIQKLKGDLPPCEVPSSYVMDHENHTVFFNTYDEVLKYGSQIYACNLKTNTWKNVTQGIRYLPRLPFGAPERARQLPSRYGGSMAFHKDKITGQRLLLLFGGQVNGTDENDPGEVSNELIAVDVDRSVWWVVDLVGGPVAARVESHLIVVDDRFFVFGGKTYEEGQYRSTESYSVAEYANNRWTWQVRDVPYPQDVPPLGFSCDAVAIQDGDSPKILLTAGCTDYTDNPGPVQLVAHSFVLFDIESTTFTTQMADNGNVGFPRKVSYYGIYGVPGSNPSSKSAIVCTFHTSTHPELYIYSGVPPQGGCKKLGLRQRIAATKATFGFFAVVDKKMYLFGWTKDKWDILAEIPQQLISA